LRSTHVCMVIVLAAALSAAGCSESEKENLRKMNDGTEDFKPRQDAKTVQPPARTQKPASTPESSARTSPPDARNGDGTEGFKPKVDPKLFPWAAQEEGKR
jgi:hypothetical protein